MVYQQETHVTAFPVDMVGGWFAMHRTGRALALLLLLAFLHGALYAFFLPPWGLIDEAQHVHYIQYIAEHQSLPVAGELYLSDQIIASLFATRHWDTFQWTPPSVADAASMGLEGYSYEAYQPPLFYLLMTPLYMALPKDILVKLYGLRAAMVMLSLITVWALYRSAALLLPQFPRLPFAAGLLLVAIPERAIATSRINNDVLLEVIAALFFFVLTHAALAGLTRRRSLLLGLLLGLGVWVKISAGLLGVPLLLLLWLHRRQPAWWKHLVWVSAVAAPLGIAIVLRNRWLYGDFTGFAAFSQLHRLSPVDNSLAGFVVALVSVLNHLWLVWWKGSNVGGNWLLTAFYWSMAGVVAIAWGRLCIEYWPQKDDGLEIIVPYPPREESKLGSLAFIYGVTVWLYAIAVMSSYYQGMVPVIQGRFLLPAMLPFVLLLVWGLWLYPRGEQLILAVVVLLWGMGLFSLFGNLIPYFYYWSELLLGKMPPVAELGVAQWVGLVYQRALFDKPTFVAPLLFALPIAYGLTLLFTLVVSLRTMGDSHRWFGNGDHIPAHSHTHSAE